MSSDSSSPDTEVVVADSRAPWRPLIGLFFIVVVFYGAQLLASIVVSLYPLLQHWSKAQASAWFDAHSILIQFLVISASTLITVTALRQFLSHYKLSLGFLGLSKPKWHQPMLGILTVPAYYLTFAILLSITSMLFPDLNVNQKQDIGFNNVVGQSQLIFTFISLVVLAPLLEEIVFRGFIYKTLRRPFGIIAAGILTSVLFGAGHLLEGGDGSLLYVGALQTFVLSLYLVWLRQKTGNLWASITLHASNNLIAFVALFILHTN